MQRPPQRVDALAWSPDSNQIAAASGDDIVGVWSIETGDERPFAYSELVEANDSNALAWSPDGSRIAAVSENTAVKVLSAITGGSLFRLFLTFGEQMSLAHLGNTVC